MILTEPKERKRFIRFAVVGVIGAGIDFGVFNLLILLFGVPSVWANVVSFSVAVFSNFTWNRYWTYPESRSKRIRRQLSEFFLVNLIGILIRTPIFAWTEPWTLALFDPIPPPLGDVLGHNTALGFSMVVVMFWNFFVNRFWTYADVSETDEQV